MSSKLKGSDNFDTGYANNGYKGFLFPSNNITLSGADSGKYIQILTTTPATFTILFPTPVPSDSNGILAGTVYTIWNVSQYGITLTTPIGKFYGSNLTGSGQASIVIAPGLTYQIVSDGINWTVIFINQTSIKLTDVFGSTWVNVTTNRKLGVTYTNTSGKYLQIVVSCHNSNVSVTGTFIVNGVSFSWKQFFITWMPQIIIPPGATYSVNNSIGLVFWAELIN